MIPPLPKVDKTSSNQKKASCSTHTTNNQPTKNIVIECDDTSDDEDDHDNISNKISEQL